MAGAAQVAAAGNSETRILDAARDAFSEKGFEGATTREIASRAGVTLGLVQYYFGSKLELWKAAVDLAFGEMKGGLEAVFGDLRQAGDREQLRTLLRAYVAFVARNPEFIRIMHDEGKRRGPRMRWLADRHVKPLFDRILPLIERLQQQGLLLGGVPAGHFVYIIVGAVGILFHQAEECKRVAGIDPTSPEAADAHARAIEALFLGSEEQNT